MTPAKKISLLIETSGLLTDKEQDKCSLFSTTQQSFTPGHFNVTSTYQDKNENGSTTEITASITSPILNQQSMIKTSFTTSISLPTEEDGPNPSGKKVLSEIDYSKKKSIVSTCTLSTSSDGTNDNNNKSDALDPIHREYANLSIELTSKDMETDNLSKNSNKALGR